jgi:AcrR family transcriptional regulator
MTRVTKGTRSTNDARSPRPREELKRDKRDRITQAAWDLFSSEGFAGTTTKAVAERAGVATGTLFLYARDKDDLLCLVMHDRLQDAVERAFATLPTEAPFVDRLMHLFGTFLDVYAANPAVGKPFVRALVDAAGPNGQKVTTMTMGFLHRLALHLRESQAKGEIGADIDPYVAAHAIFCLYTGALLGWASGVVSLEVARDPGLRLAFALQFRGLHA